MRLITIALVAAFQAPPLPPAYPRPGASKLFENNRVQVWDIAWLKQQYALHRHLYDLIGVYYTDGDRTIVSTEGAKRPVSTKAWDTAFQLRGVTHIEEGASDAPLRAVFIELKEDAPLGVADGAAAPPPFTGAGGKQLRDNERATMWEFVPAPVAGAPHRHLRDAVVLWFNGRTPHVAFIPRATVHADEGTARADRAYIIELK